MQHLDRSSRYREAGRPKRYPYRRHHCEEGSFVQIDFRRLFSRNVRAAACATRRSDLSGVN
jgi:hypothetical protein